MPEQHWEAVAEVQAPPLAVQAVAWQLPLVQMPVQHSPAEAQVVPLPEQLFAWQLPLAQKVEQHCVPAVQLVPLAEQALPLVVVEDLEQPRARRATAEAMAKSMEVRRRMAGPRSIQRDEALAVSVTPPFGLVRHFVNDHTGPPFRRRGDPRRRIAAQRRKGGGSCRRNPPPAGGSETPQGARPQDVGQCP